MLEGTLGSRPPVRFAQRSILQRSARAKRSDHIVRVEWARRGLVRRFVDASVSQGLSSVVEGGVGVMAPFAYAGGDLSPTSTGLPREAGAGADEGKRLRLPDRTLF